MPIVLVLAGACRTDPARHRPVVISQHRLDEMLLAERFPELRPERHGLLLGGIFSALARAPGDPPDVFLCAADRGPNLEIRDGDQVRRVFPLRGYTPAIHRVRLEGERIVLLGSTPIRTPGGRPVTGLPNTADDETPYCWEGRERLPLDPDGLDVEGLAVAPDGSFWLADEYRPSLVHVGADGVVRARLIPEGVELPAEGAIHAVLPRIYAWRRRNRGFEGLCLSRDGSRLYAALESPLDFPDAATGRASRMIRLVVVDPARPATVAEHVVVAESAAEFDGSTPDQMRLGDLAWVDPTTLLVVERTEGAARIYALDLEGASDLRSTPWSDPARVDRPLEGLAPRELAAHGIVAVRKRLLVDLTALPEVPRKIEGLAIVDARTLAIGNDNDFGFSGFDSTGRAIPSGVPSLLTRVRLPRPLPIAR